MIVRTSRRTFMRGSAAAAVASPFLRMLERPAHAQAVPKRLIFFVSPLGAEPDASFPGGGAFGKPLEALIPFKQKVLAMRGLANRAGNQDPIDNHHTDFPSMLTGRHFQGGGYGSIQGTSLDVYIANQLQKTASTKLPIYHFGVARTNGLGWPIFSNGTGRPITPQLDAQQTFSTLFSNLNTTPTTGPATIDPAIARTLAEDRSILDAMTEELNAIQCRLGAEEKHKFVAHMEAIRTVEKSLSAGPGTGTTTSCAKPGQPAGGDYRTQFRTQMDNMVAALACDVTRVGSIVADSSSSQMKLTTWVPSLPNVGLHAMAHGDSATAHKQLALIDGFYAGEFAYLLGKLDKIPVAQGSGTLLDNSVVVWLHEQGNGKSHARLDHQMVIAGGVNGYFKTGSILNLGGQPHVRLFANIAEAMGVPFDPRNPFNDGAMTGSEKGYFSAGGFSEVRRV
jgi:hypothetical protein